MDIGLELIIIATGDGDTVFIVSFSPLLLLISTKCLYRLQ